MKTTTAPGIIKRVAQTLGSGSVIHHIPTEENLLGQSGIHTFVSDVQDVCALHWEEGQAAVNKALFNLLIKQEM